MGVRSSAVDAIEGEESTVGSRGLLASSIAEQKALRSLPASSAPTSSRVGMVLEAMLEAAPPVVQRETLPTAPCRTLLEGVSCVRFNWPAPDAALLLPVIIRACALRSTRRAAPMGSPCEAARTPVLPWTFGQGRPHAGG